MEKVLCILATVAICFMGANGIVIEEQSSRITGGNAATLGQFPYLISLQQLSLLPNQLLAHRCGGAMITLQHALTAASCTYTVYPNGTVSAILASQYRVFAGDVLLSNDNAADRTRPIANYTVHPDHIRSPALLNNIAIITLQSPFLNTTVLPMPPMATNNFIPDDFTLCTIAGWGSTSAAVTTANNALRYATKFTYNQLLCTQLYNSFVGSANIHPNMICAASYDILSVGCHGDLGSPLVCNGQLTGILSMSNTCSVTSYPEVYARVSNYTTWIRSISGASTYKPQLALFAIAAVVLAKMFS